MTLNNKLTFFQQKESVIPSNLTSIQTNVNNSFESKLNLLLYSPYDAKGCNELVGAYLRVIAPEGNKAPFCRTGGEPLATPCPI